MLARTVLIADDDIDTRIILRVLLERHQYKTIEAANADEAMAAAQQHSLDLVILNYPMADGAGTTLVSRLRMLKGTRSVPILNLTSRVIPYFLEQAEAEGVSLSLAKPIDIDNVLHIVEKLTARQTAVAG